MYCPPCPPLPIQTQITLQSINPYIINNTSDTNLQINITTTTKPNGFNLLFNQNETHLILGNTDKATQTYLDLIPSIRLQININGNSNTLVLNTLDNGTVQSTQIKINIYNLKIIYTYVCNNKQHYWTILNIYLNLYQ